jgi:sensor histidine kinase YesM
MEFENDLNPDEIFLPPMVIQPFIENAIWHGAVSNGEPVHLVIRFYKKGPHLVCMIEDNGVGIIASLKSKSDQVTIAGMSHHQSMAIENTKQRIRVLNEKYNLNSSLVIEDKSRLNGGRESGTLVTLEFPIKNFEI